MNSYIYIMTNRSNTVMYVGATTDLKDRIFAHRNRLDLNSFTARYKLTKLIYYECFNDVESAFQRERQVKDMSRKNKMKLISQFNPDWNDLFEEIVE